MPNLEEQLTSPVLRRAEIERLTLARDVALLNGDEHDAAAYAGVLQLFTDYEDGVVRCYSCGRIKGRRMDCAGPDSIGSSDDPMSSDVARANSERRLKKLAELGFADAAAFAKTATGPK